MADNYSIDRHKLHLHPRRVADWQEKGDVYPIYMEFSPAGGCNHRCKFCGLDFMGYQARFLPTELLLTRLQEMGRLGIKSIMYAGEGEPFLHKDMCQIARATKEAGIDVSFTTNAVLLKPQKAEEVLSVASWIKVSCNAGTAQTYAEVHGARAQDFDVVMQNLADAAKIKARHGYGCTLGFQMLLLPENANEAVTLAKLVRDLGADYLVIKPYSQHPQSKTQVYAEVEYEDCAALARELEPLNCEGFQVIFRHEALKRAVNGGKKYDRCLALPFWGYVDAGGRVWGCSVFLGDERFLYGNILESTFAEIWQGEKRRKSLEWCACGLDASQCRINCRMDAINQYLHELTHPGAHVNFI